MQVPKPKKSNEYYDWTKIKSEYASTNKSLADLAKEYDIALTAMQKHSSREKWVEARKQFREKTVNKVIEKASETTANKLARMATSIDKFTETVESVCLKGSEIFEEVDEKGVVRSVDTKAIKDLASALRELAATTRNVYDIPTSTEIETRRLAAERLQLEKAKFEREKQEIDTNVRVTFEKGVEEFAK
jgi:uncharacterized protein YoxC